MRHRRPDGGFVLRFLALISQLYGFTKHPPFEQELLFHPAWRATRPALLLLQLAALKCEKRLERLFHTLINVPDRRTRKTLSDILAHWTKR